MAKRRPGERERTRHSALLDFALPGARAGPGHHRGPAPGLAAAEASSRTVTVPRDHAVRYPLAIPVGAASPGGASTMTAHGRQAAVSSRLVTVVR